MQQKQTCIILAGGLGTRLRSTLPDVPKCLAPVGGRPFLDFQIESLLRSGVSEIVLALGYGADQVITSLRRPIVNQWPVRYVVEPCALGTGGAIRFAMDKLNINEAWVSNGDTYLSGDLGKMISPLRVAEKEGFRMATVNVPDRFRFGGVEIDDYGWVKGFVDKGQHGPGSINAGLYRLSREALPAGEGALSLENDVLPGLVAQGKVRDCPIDGTFIDIGVPEDYFRFCAQHSRA
jgi:D-glycero-alpha-D-manno-heptose 1-phosphate guanylyltransferase